MKLNQYPIEIAIAEKAVLNANIVLDNLVEQISKLEMEIEAIVASDPELKNDTQRKATRMELQQDKTYQIAKTAVYKQRLAKEELQIELNQLRNEFSVAKLEARLQIVSLEAVA